MMTAMIVLLYAFDSEINQQGIIRHKTIPFSPTNVSPDSRRFFGGHT